MLLALFAACSNELDVTAEPKEMYAVYGVLDPGQELNVVRLTKAFLVDGNGYETAADSALSVRGANVTLITTLEDGTEEILKLEPLDTLREPGVFQQPQTIYGTRQPIRAGHTYQLEIVIPRRPEPFVIRSQTTTPSAPVIGNPDNREGRELGEYKEIKFENRERPFVLRFSRYNTRDDLLSEGAIYEMRAVVNYTDAAAPGETKQVEWGPQIFENSDTDDCPIRGRNVCRTVGREFLIFLDRKFQRLGSETRDFRYDDSDLSEAAFFEVSAVDSFLHEYRRVNNPAFVDWTTVKPEYTNIENGVGVFGAVNRDTAYFRLNYCAQAAARLNGRIPEDCPAY